LVAAAGADADEEGV